MASYTVTSTAGVGGSVSPASVVVNEGGSTGFSILANAGFVIDSVSGCNGSLVGDTYTTGAVTANCSVAATFVALTPPVANAGSDQTVDENTPVTLNGSATDSDGSIVSYSWSQLSGPAVLINNSLNAIASFDAPEVTANQDIVFQLTVTDDDGLTASAIVTITIENIVDNSVAVVAATGMPAAGFPDGFIYWSVSFPSIGDSGHIAFGGAADTSIGSTSQNTNALWAGLPDNLSVIVKENDTLPGLPSNVLVDGVIYGSSTKPPIVTKSGYVSHLVGLKGAVAAQNNTAIVAHINDVLYTVVREGDQGQGLPPGYIYDQIIDHAFSDTGLVFSSLVTNSGLIQGTGLWFWDLNELHLLGFSEITANTVSIPEESPNLFGGDCEFNGFNNLQINNAEEIGFVASFKAASGRTCNANSSLLKWKQNVFEDIFSHQQPVDGLDDYVFNLLLPQFMSYALQDNGDIGIVSRINQMNLSDPRDYYWVYKNSGDKEYLAITGELLPGSTLETIAFGLAGTIATAPTSSNDGAYLVSTSPQPTVNSPLKPYLLKGSPLPLPYSTVSEIGASQLSRLVKAGDVPPNFPSTTFFSSISLILGQSPTINSQGDIIFTATRADAANPANNIYGIWRIDPAGNISPLLEQMDKVFFNGAEVNQIGLLPIIHGAGSGRYKRHSDTGQVIVQGELENAFQAIILLSP
jgi:hypothetical protein